jgi:hypothetical protein
VLFFFFMGLSLFACNLKRLRLVWIHEDDDDSDAERDSLDDAENGRRAVSKIDVGQRVRVTWSAYEGTVTYSDPTSDYVYVDGHEFRRYEVRPVASTWMCLLAL